MMSMYPARRCVYISHMEDGRNEAGVGVRVLACVYQRYERWDHANLSAPYWRVYWNKAPGWRVVLDGRETALAADRLVVIPPETPFAARSERSSHHLFVHFVADDPYDHVAAAVYAVRIGREVRKHVEELASRAAQGNTAVGRASVLVRLLCYEALSAVPLDTLQPAPYGERVRRVMATMAARLGAPLTNAVLARECDMSTNAFIRLFTADVGFSPQAWYIRRRVDYACELLHHTAMSIDQIAEKTGFCDRAHFSKAFKRLRGVGPAAFRRTGAAAVRRL